MAATKEAGADSTRASNMLQKNCHFQSLHDHEICRSEWANPVSDSQTLITVEGKPVTGKHVKPRLETSKQYMEFSPNHLAPFSDITAGRNRN